MLKALKRDRAFYGYLLRLTGPIALQNLITFSLGLIDTLMVSQLGYNSPFLRRLEISPCQWPLAVN